MAISNKRLVGTMNNISSALDAAWQQFKQNFQPTKIISPVPENNTLDEAGKLNYVAQNQAYEAATRQNPNPTINNQTVQYPEWLANAPQVTQAPIPPKITIPYSQTGQPYTLKPELSQILLNAFNDIQQSTNSAKVLNHPKSQTYTPVEIQQHGGQSWNYGENAGFKVNNIDVSNPDGSIDRGLFRINNNTFNGIMTDPHWGKLAREKFGINSWDDMNDPQKNAYMAKLIYERQGWGAWFAAPLELRQQGSPNLVALSKLITQSK